MRSIKSLIMSLLFLTLVVSLFFIPEIVDAYKTYSSQGVSTKQSLFSGLIEKASNNIKNVSIKNQNSSAENSSLESEVKSPKNALDKVLALVSSDYLANPTGDPKASLNLSTMDAGLKPLEGRGVSWPMILQDSVKKSFRSAQTESENILREVPDSYTETKSALVSFINGLAWIQRGDKSMQPEKALQYIEELDFKVSEAMFKERLDRGIFLRWSSINLGTLLTNAQAQRTRNRISVPFNPRTTLAAVEIRRAFRTDYTKYLRKGKKIPTRISITGFIMGTDTQTLELYRNSDLISKIIIPKKPDNEGKRLFRFSINRGEGLYTIRAIDSFGYVHDTHYQFFPRAEIFPRQRNRVMVIPVVEPQNKRKFSISEIDGRLDGLFRVSLGSSMGGFSSNYDTF